jgi:hypothetical protein
VCWRGSCVSSPASALPRDRTPLCSQPTHTAPSAHPPHLLHLQSVCCCRSCFCGSCEGSCPSHLSYGKVIMAAQILMQGCPKCGRVFIRLLLCVHTHTRTGSCGNGCTDTGTVWCTHTRRCSTACGCLYVHWACVWWVSKANHTRGQT